MSGYKTANIFTELSQMRENGLIINCITSLTIGTKFNVITNIVLHKTSHGIYGKVPKLYTLIHEHIWVF